MWWLLLIVLWAFVWASALLFAAFALVAALILYAIADIIDHLRR